jgi:SAM-dependent methyltransferase
MKTVRYVVSGLALCGIDLRRSGAAVTGFLPFLRNLRRFRKAMRTMGDAGFSWGRLKPSFGDRLSEAGTASGHYFHQDLLVAQKIFEAKPEKHVDIGSRIDGFVAHVASFRPLEVIDIRPVSSTVRHVRFIQQDIVADSFPLREYCDSASCLHAIEHLGLGRYGDPIDVRAHEKGLENLARMLKTGGTLYLSAPIGPARVEFDAQRVFSMPQLLALVRRRFSVRSLSYVDDNGRLFEKVPAYGAAVEATFGCNYGCAILECVRE